MMAGHGRIRLQSTIPLRFLTATRAIPICGSIRKAGLWWFVFRLLKIKDPDGIRSLWGFCAEHPDDPSPKWKAPVFAGFGLGLNKPTVLSNGDWLRPVDNDQESRDGTRTQFFVSHDQGRSFTFLSKFGVKDVTRPNLALRL
jgi:hypothetical protein